MKGICEVDIPLVLTEASSHLVTTKRQVTDPTRTKISILCGACLIILILVLTLMFTLNRRIELLEHELHTQQAMIRKLEDYVSQMKYNYGKESETYDGEATEAEKRPHKGRLNQEIAIGAREVSEISRSPRAAARNAGSVGVGTNVDAKRVKRMTSTTAAPREKKRKGPKPDRNGRQRGRENQTRSMTCDFVNQCNDTRGRNDQEHLVAHFVQNSDSNQVVPGCRHDELNHHFIRCDDEILGNWVHASWMTRHGAGPFSHHGFRIITRGHPSRSKIEVKEAGIYYVYSQVTFADESFFLGHSIMLGNEPQFTCTLWVSDACIQANTCVTGGLLRIDAGQEIYIHLIESNRVINMDKENTFFGLMRMSPLGG